MIFRGKFVARRFWRGDRTRDAEGIFYIASSCYERASKNDVAQMGSSFFRRRKRAQRGVSQIKGDKRERTGVARQNEKLANSISAQYRYVNVAKKRAPLPSVFLAELRDVSSRYARRSIRPMTRRFRLNCITWQRASEFRKPNSASIYIHETDMETRLRGTILARWNTSECIRLFVTS